MSRSELASFPGYQNMSKYIIEVVHAGISSLKINVKGRKGVKKKTLRHMGIPKGSEQQKDLSVAG